MYRYILFFSTSNICVVLKIDRIVYPRASVILIYKGRNILYSSGFKIGLTRGNPFGTEVFSRGNIYFIINVSINILVFYTFTLIIKIYKCICKIH